MNELFVPYEIAKQLKEIGFDEPCFAGYQINHLNEYNLYYKGSGSKAITPHANVYGKYCHQNNHVVKAPLYQQVFDWFRDKGYESEIKRLNRFDYAYHAGVGYSDYLGGKAGYANYEEAQDECIKYLVSLIKG